jgi:hypothetical protein
MTHHRIAATAVLLALALSGCGSDGEDVATDPGPTTTAPTPTAAPTGVYPEFAPRDYTYTLVLACFCAGGGTPVDVTVRDGEVVDAVYDGDGRGAEAGTPADALMWLTINDVIDAANGARERDADSVRVEWPEGQDHPDSVYVDGDERTADDEIGYELSQVVVG